MKKAGPTSCPKSGTTLQRRARRCPSPPWRPPRRPRPTWGPCWTRLRPKSKLRKHVGKNGDKMHFPNDDPMLLPVNQVTSNITTGRAMVTSSQNLLSRSYNASMRRRSPSSNHSDWSDNTRSMGWLKTYDNSLTSLPE